MVSATTIIPYSHSQRGRITRFQPFLPWRRILRRVALQQRNLSSSVHPHHSAPDEDSSPSRRHRSHVHARSHRLTYLRVWSRLWPTKLLILKIILICIWPQWVHRWPISFPAGTIWQSVFFLYPNSYSRFRFTCAFGLSVLLGIHSYLLADVAYLTNPSLQHAKWLHYLLRALRHIVSMLPGSVNNKALTSDVVFRAQGRMY